MEDKKDKPKGSIGKLQEFAEDKEEIKNFSTFVRLGILVWSGAIFNIELRHNTSWEQDKIDPTLYVFGVYGSWQPCSESRPVVRKRTVKMVEVLT